MDIVVVIILLLLFNTYLVKLLASRFIHFNENYSKILLFIHFAITLGYIAYTVYSRSDSVSYFYKSANTDEWFSFFDTGTSFIGFITWPFSNALSLSFYATMLIFSYIGYLAVLIFYIIATENIQTQTLTNGLTTIELLLLLPNLHFWSSSIGKGSVILFGLAIFSFGLSRFNRRIPHLAIGAFLVYMVRPHILLAIVISIVLGLFLTSSKTIKPIFKWLIILVALGAFYYLSDSVLKFTDTDSLDITNSSTLSHKASELGKASSGVDLQNYNIFYKMFTFWFRPLFYDGLGALGFIASVENFICLILFFIIIKEGITGFKKWNGLFKIFVFAFLLTSFILAQVSGNLGIILRQKSQLMPLFFIIFYKVYSDRQTKKLLKIAK